MAKERADDAKIAATQVELLHADAEKELRRAEDAAAVNRRLVENIEKELETRKYKLESLLAGLEDDFNQLGQGNKYAI